MVPTLAEGSPGPGTSQETAHPDADQRLGAHILPSVDIDPITLCRKWTSATFRETLGGKQSKGCRGCWVDYKLSESSSGSAGFPEVARVRPEKRGPLSHSGPNRSHGPQSEPEEEVTRHVEALGKDSGMALRMAPVLRTQKDSDTRQTQVWISCPLLSPRLTTLGLHFLLCKMGFLYLARTTDSYLCIWNTQHSACHIKSSN